MLKAWSCYFGLAVLIVAVLTMAACGSSVEVPEIKDGKIRVGSDISWTPFEFFPEGSEEPTGFDVELFEAVADKLAVEVEWDNIEFTEIIPALQAKRFDVIVSGMTITETRDEIMDFVPYYFAGITLLVIKGNPEKISSLDDLSGLSVSTQIGTTWQDALENKNRELREDEMPLIDIRLQDSDSLAVEELRRGNVDANMNDNPVVDYIASLEPDVFDSLSYVMLLDSAPFGWGIRVESPELKDALKEALTELIEDGTYDRIMKDWGLERGSIVGKGYYE